ncbi:hypothetical protein [Williamsia sterculiae]|uniref:Uncharacterized protein n=1 Tax=Williamsia sterculiae TaxID=1344003 RepID=A0A1N7HE22_9NOCA|nr:hypothetical protein [Williamsia sterculiae]SIS23082.1 hypothetical protein SAMN05445060_4048 [Williamsia sterculiae]
MPAQAWVTLVVGVVAAVGVIATWWQKNHADRRAEWWRRLSWAFDNALDEDPAKSSFGWLMVEHLGRSQLATKADDELLQKVAERWVNGDTDTSTMEESR